MTNRPRYCRYHQHAIACPLSRTPSWLSFLSQPCRHATPSSHPLPHFPVSHCFSHFCHTCCCPPSPPQVGDEQEYLINTLVQGKPTYKAIIVPGGKVRIADLSLGCSVTHTTVSRCHDCAAECCRLPGRRSVPGCQICACMQARLRACTNWCRCRVSISVVDLDLTCCYCACNVVGPTGRDDVHCQGLWQGGRRRGM